jgi:surfeit locus 1 family protein
MFVMSRLRELKSVIGLSLATLALFSLFVSLGVWQLRRAAEKRDLAQAMREREQLPPLRLTALLKPDKELAYRKVVTTGIFEPRHQIFLDNRTFQGQAGYHVITPLKIAGTDLRVLVNRGWVRMDFDRGKLPQLVTPEGEVKVNGIVHFPSPPPPFLKSKAVVAPAWGKQWLHLDLDDFSRRAGYALQPFEVFQDPDDPHGFTRVWPRFDGKEHMHYGYAAQWFGFAILTVFFYFMILRNQSRE